MLSAKFHLPSLDLGTLRTSVELRDERLVVRLIGAADMRHASAMNSFCSCLHSEAQRLRLKFVTVDLTNLEFLSSACFKALVQWLVSLSSGPGHRYDIEFLSNVNVHWQRRSLDALAALAPDSVRISKRYSASCA